MSTFRKGSRNWKFLVQISYVRGSYSPIFLKNEGKKILVEEEKSSQKVSPIKAFPG